MDDVTDKYSKIAKEEALNYDLINIKNENNSIFKLILSFVCLITFIDLFFTLVYSFFINKNENIVLFLFIIYYLSITVTVFLSGKVNLFNETLFRTKLGLEVTEKMEGLKNFLTDFGNINERKIEEIKLWDYYMIYAVLFDLKGNLDKDAKDLYNRLNNF